MNYGQIRKYDVANGPGIRTSIFVTGCPFHCEGCFNKEYQLAENGTRWSQEAEDELISYLKIPYVNGLSVLGGEPLVQDDDLRKLLKRAKEQTNKSIWLWTGYCYEQLTDAHMRVLEYVDILVDGLFDISKKDLKLKFRGSSNQRIIDLKKTKNSGHIVIWDGLNENIKSI
ncbi:MAG: anaerobic ribonucleoside-triphosphate reductase activating protein [Oscillospiraceae bacterium]|nr:anaerobic ribonucleoside-triphosphate reductase activating protein [Oscillospiraceae bacterium]